MPKMLVITTVARTLEAFLLPFAEHFRRNGWQVDALARGATESARCQAAFNQLWDVEWSRNPLQPQNIAGTAKRIKRIVETEDYDIVHVHTPVAAFVTRFALRHLRRRGRPNVIYTAHGFHFHQGGKRLKNAAFLTLEKMAGRWTDYLVVINREDEATAVKHKLVPPRNVHYMPGIGVDTATYHSEKVSQQEVARVREELDLAAADKLLLMVAEFIPRKRHSDVLNAFIKVARPEAHLAFAGQGPLMDNVKQMVTRLGIHDRVHFLGQRRDIPALMRASVAILLPSEQEGLPRSIMEAMALEVPVIASRIRGNTELLEDGCGILVEVGDADVLARAMMQVLERPNEAKRMSERARERVMAYELSQIIVLHEALYSDALREKSGAGS